MIKFEIKGSKDKKLIKFFEQTINRKMPFIASRALNRTTAQMRNDYLRKEYGSVFDKRNEQFFKLTHTIANSSSRTMKENGVLRSAILRNEVPAPAFTVKGRTKTSVEGPLTKRRVDTSFMEFHASGGTRRPLRTKKAVPMTVGGYKITRSKRTGKVSKAKEAKTLYPQDNTFVRKSKKSGKSVLFVRTGKRTVKPAYHFQPSVVNTKKYNPFGGHFNYIANQRMKFHLKQGMRQIIRERI